MRPECADTHILIFLKTGTGFWMFVEHFVQLPEMTFGTAEKLQKLLGSKKIFWPNK